MKKVIIVGNGKLAELILKNFSSYSDTPVMKYFSDIEAGKESIFVHIGSGRQYTESLKRAMLNGASYIQAATEKHFKLTPPVPGNFTYVHAPNLDLNIIKLFYLLQLGKGLFDDETITIMESHQKEKSSLPGTAIKMCDFLGIQYENIVSIRDPRQQQKLNITTLNHHAYHKIKIGDNDSNIIIETKIEGAESYVKGLAKIIEGITKLENGNYEIEDLLKMNLL